MDEPTGQGCWPRVAPEWLLTSLFPESKGVAQRVGTAHCAANGRRAPDGRAASTCTLVRRFYRRLLVMLADFSGDIRNDFGPYSRDFGDGALAVRHLSVANDLADNRQSTAFWIVARSHRDRRGIHRRERFQHAAGALRPTVAGPQAKPPIAARDNRLLPCCGAAAERIAVDSTRPL